MNIKDLPESVRVMLDADSGIKFSKNGDFETTYEIELVCFSKKIYAQTWPLRQRLMQVFTGLVGKLDTMAEQATSEEKPADSDGFMNAEDLENACMIGGFDAQAALEEFKTAIVGNGLIKLDSDTAMNKNRWQTVDSFTQEMIMFEYLANFIQRCVLTGTATS